VSLLPGRGDGTFGPAARFAAGAGPVAAAAAGTKAAPRKVAAKKATKAPLSAKEAVERARATLAEKAAKKAPRPRKTPGV
jgi:hypothetical protein